MQQRLLIGSLFLIDSLTMMMPSFVVIVVPVFRVVTVSVESRMLSLASSSKLTKSVPEIDENRDI